MIPTFTDRQNDVRNNEAGSHIEIDILEAGNCD